MDKPFGAEFSDLLKYDFATVLDCQSVEVARAVGVAHQGEVSMIKSQVSTMAGTITVVFLASMLNAQSIVPPFDQYFTLHEVGTPSLPNDLGGLAIDPTNPGTLLVIAHGSTINSTIWAISVVRNGDGHIVSLSPDPPLLVCTAAAPEGGVFGSLVVAPNGVLLFPTFSDNELAEVFPGDSVPTFAIPLEHYGIPSYASGFGIVPPGWCGAGRAAILSSDLAGYTSTSLAFFEVATGAWLLGGVGAASSLDFIPNGIAFLPDSCITVEIGRYVLVCHNFNAEIGAYRPDGTSNPDNGSHQTFIEAFAPRGITVDPITNDLLFISRVQFDTVFAVQSLGTCGCEGDINHDGEVNGADLGSILASWGDTECIPPGADADFDGHIDGADLGVILANWGNCPR